ncbi:MAG: FmdB family zinc ribbon protein [Bryobacteraceae bacterium]
MPMYEYKCASCGTVFEVIQKFSDQPLREHPGCGGVVERLISAPALQFKGTGWYVTDYGKNGSSHSEKADKAKTSSTDSKPAESKPAASTKETTTPAKSE